MFLSTENPPHDPLSSSPSPSSFLHLTTSSDELGQTHLQNFSIRDYAYSNRKNNIKNNWPFSPKSLQLCSTQGLTDPLPPFQKVSNVSNQFETTAYSSSGKQIVSHVRRGSDLAKLGLTQTIEETSKGVSSQSRINGLLTSTSVWKSSKVEIGVAGTSSNNKRNKKCGRGVMVKPKEDSTCGGLVMTTTCPICKTFSSASNTTLNAHIDQCLSVDSSVPPVGSTKPRVNQCLSVSSKPNKARRAKPEMKVKTMVDVYASAKKWTLEDLDKRNGTKWASILSHTNQVVAQVSKKRKASPVGVGPVYIDAKGQKLRILTEFSEKKTSTTPPPLREHHEDGSCEKKSVRHGSNEISKSSRKRRIGKKHYKHLKAYNTSEIHSGEGSSKGHRRIYNQRMLATRGLVSKKLNEKGHKFNALRDEASEDDDGDDDDSWSGGDPDSSPLNKQKPQSRSFRVEMSEKEEKSLARTHLDTVQLKKRLASIQEDKYPLVKKKLSAPFVANGWRRLDLSEEEEEEEEETGKWESEMTQERELSDDNPSFSSDEEEEDDDNNNKNKNKNKNKRGNVLDKSNDATTTIGSEREMYYSEEVGNMMYGGTTCDEDVRFESEVRGKGSLFVGVDTIQIPGPPGSFLPSPRDMCYDDTLGNSSVITSQIQSFDRNSSESPVSNFAAGRLSFPVDIPSSYTTTPMSFCVPSHHEPVTVDKTTSPRLSCCCQRKERISQVNALKHQTSHLLQRRAAAYSSTSMNLTKPPPTRLDPNHAFDLQSQFSNRAVVPPSPNPVLRLMGKDLMVMNQVEASRDGSLKPTTQFLDHPPCAGTGLCFNTGLYLRNGFESTYQPQAQTQTQASPLRNNFVFEHLSYLSPRSGF